MRWFVSALAALVFALASAASAQTLTPQEEAGLARAIDRGQLIYQYDQAAWITTDAMLEELPDPGKAGILGWLVEPRGDGLTVIYYGARDGRPHAIFSGDVKGNKVVATKIYGEDEDAALTPLEQQMVAARETAMSTAFQPCVQAAFNTVVLPGESPEQPLLVYLLTPQTRSGIYPFGGHYRLDLGPDGKVLYSRAFTRDCVNLSLGEAANGALPGITHLLDPIPTEIHVFLSLWLGKTVYVMTPNGDRSWAVEGRRIRLLDPGAK
jgi:hypothetical protein